MVGNCRKLQEGCMGARQRSGEGVVRRNGCPKGCFWRDLKGAERRNGLSKKHPFGQPFLRTTPSPLLWRALIGEKVKSIAFWGS